jgi:radical SAM protein with 4Fe4S-binding SPASM domain
MKVDADSHKLIYHPERVARWLATGDCPPIYVEIGLTNRCNHHCIFCALDWLEKKPEFIDADLMKRCLTDMHESGVKSVMFAGEGEPLLHPKAAEIIEHAHKTGLDVALATNGVLFTPDRAERILPCLSWMRVSLDAASPEVHQQVHQGKITDYETIIGNIRAAAEIKQNGHYPVTIGVQLLIIPENITEIEPFTRTLSGCGVDNVQIKPYSQHPMSKNRFAPDPASVLKLEPVVRGFERDGFQVIFRSGTIGRITEERCYDRCYGLPFYTLIEADGSVIPCNLYHENREYTYGNINTESFSEIWDGEQRRAVINRIASDGVTGCREVCRLDPINRYLHALKHPHPHVNFI